MSVSSLVLTLALAAAPAPQATDSAAASAPARSADTPAAQAATPPAAPAAAPSAAGATGSAVVSPPVDPAGAAGYPSLPALPTLPGAPAASAGTAAGQPGAEEAADADADADGIVVTARRRYFKGDPLEGVNVVSFEAVQAVDKAFVGPVAMGYKHNVPSPIRTGLRNFLTNIGEPIAFVNFLLQHRVGKAAETVGRFAINTTLGIAGLFDVAKRKPFNLPHRNNGIAYTLGFYGVGPGPYMFLPLIGPTTLRDVIGRMLDLMLVPTLAGSPFNKPAYALAAGTINSIDERAEADDTLRKLREESPDPYSAVRDHYLKGRQAEIDALHSHRKPKKAPEGAEAPATAPESPAAPSEPAAVAPAPAGVTLPLTDRVPPVSGDAAQAVPAAGADDVVDAPPAADAPCVPDAAPAAPAGEVPPSAR